MVFLNKYFLSLRSDSFGVSGEHGGLPDVVQPEVQHAHTLQTFGGGGGGKSVTMPTKHDL